MNCNCSYCTQFFFARNHKKITKKNTHQNEILHKDVSTHVNTLIQPERSENHNNINFTIKDMDTIYQLNQMQLDIAEISNRSNLPKSVVEYILKIINWKK